ncbi:MAG TPA: NAD-dependent epimerase/dehydratase family protein [Euryarchaeota archaeon]|nr:NAD-dependent epimerase/dehydratase family protein [Euryarchaeota archaeon]
MAAKVLVTGPFGQIGSDLVPELQRIHGKDNVIALGHRTIPDDFDGLLERADVRDKEAIEAIIKKHSITEIYHLASLLSAVGESKPQLAWDINMNGLKSLLDLAVEYKIKVFWASSIAVFGPTTPQDNTPQHTILEPTTMYGVTKLAGELLCQYYHLKFGLDVRSLRYPGLISWKAEPGGGTTDYAVDIYYRAVRGEKFVCFVKEDTSLPMMYMDDAVKGTIDLMQAPAEKIKIRTSYNHGAINFTVKELVDSVKKHVPNLEVSYAPDHRQAIADSWPSSVDDSVAREQWGWSHDFDLDKMTEVMLKELEKKFSQ